MRFFVNEGELMRKFEHPALLRIYGAWKQNGTAYMAMDLVTGRSLVDTMLGAGSRRAKANCGRCSTTCWARWKACTRRACSIATSTRAAC